MWDFDCYINPDTRKIIAGEIQKRKENVFTKLFLKTIHYIYYTFIICMERDKLSVVLKKLKITNITRDMNHKCPRTQVKAILQAWNPLALVIMKQCYDIIPSPADITDKKVQQLICSNRYFENDKLRDCTSQMLKTMKDVASTTCIVYISKMFSVNKKNLSQNKAKIFVPRPRNSQKNTKEEKVEESVKNQPPEQTETEVQLDKTKDNVIIALGRIFGGTFKVGNEIYILDSDYDPCKEQDIKQITIRELYMMLGRELVLTNEMFYGNICGIGGLDDSVLRTATLSSTKNCLPLNERILMEPIVRNTIEPVNPRDLPKLREALKYLTQSDSCVQVVMQETGEHVLVTAGDVHLAKCLEDLKTKFIDFDINISKPMVSLRETVYYPKGNVHSIENSIETNIPDLGISFEATVVPLPDEIGNVLKANYDLLQTVEEHRLHQAEFSENMLNSISKLKHQLTTVFNEISDFWGNFSSKVWSVGKGRDSNNLLINNTHGYLRDIFTEPDKKDPRSAYDHHIVNGFQICCRSGPICEEPLTNCVFIISNYRINETLNKVEAGNIPVVVNIPLTIKHCLRDTILSQEQRLVEPIFMTDIQVTVNILGKVYSVISRRHGKVLDAVGMDQEERTFRVKAQIPVIESDGFANEIRKTTSGQANPTLRFSHYEIIDADPYFEGEEDDTNDACADALRANKLMKETRRRKGLLIDEQVVVHAEKQRTLNKKK